MACRWTSDLQQKGHRLHSAVALFYWHKVPFDD